MQHSYFLGFSWDTVDISFTLPSDTLIDTQQLAHAYLQEAHNYSPSGYVPFGQDHFLCQWLLLSLLIPSDNVNVYHSPAHLFLSFHFSLPVQCQLLKLSHLQHNPVPLQFPLPDVVIVTGATPHPWTLYFQGCSLPASFCDTTSGSMCKIYIALQELQVITLKLCKMPFRLSSKVVTIYLDSSTAEIYLCYQGSTVSLFLYRLALLHFKSDQ